MKAEGLTTMDIFHDFVSCLNDESMSKRCTSHIVRGGSGIKTDGPVQDGIREEQGRAKCHQSRGPINETQSTIG